jgi:hypothetical protein
MDSKRTLPRHKENTKLALLKQKLENNFSQEYHFTKFI